MRQLNLIEQTGHGVPLIVSKYGKEVFEITDNFIIVTIPYSVVNNYVYTDDYQLSNSEQKVLNILKINKNTTISDLCKVLDIKQTTINKAIKSLKEKGILKRCGSNKTGSWIIINN